MSEATDKQIDYILALAREVFPNTGRSPDFLSSYRHELGLTQREACGHLTKRRSSAIIKELLSMKAN